MHNLTWAACTRHAHMALGRCRTTPQNNDGADWWDMEALSIFAKMVTVRSKMFPWLYDLPRDGSDWQRHRDTPEHKQALTFFSEKVTVWSRMFPGCVAVWGRMFPLGSTAALHGSTVLVPLIILTLGVPAGASSRCTVRPRLHPRLPYLRRRRRNGEMFVYYGCCHLRRNWLTQQP